MTTIRDERGDIVGSWLLKLLAFLLVFAFVAFEALAVVVTNVGLEDNAREVARAARDEYRTTRSLARATEIAEQTAELRDAQVTAVVTDGEDLVVEMQRQAPTILVHRLGPLEELARATTSSRISWTS